MELPGTAYLYNLSLLAMTFIGFAAIVMILQQALGHKLSRLDALRASVHMELGLMISAAALLPPLLMMWELPSPIVWSVSSGLAACPPLAHFLIYPARRRAASGERTPFYVRLNLFIILLISLSLFMNAAGVLREPAGAVFLTALTVFLIYAVSTFLQALHLTLRSAPHVKRRTKL